MTEEKKLTKKERNIRAQLNNEENNPCYKEHVLSLKCLSQNNYNGEMCQLYFTNYNNCKTFWNTVIRQRKIDGTKPYLPPIEERQQIKNSFFKKEAL